MIYRLGTLAFLLFILVGAQTTQVKTYVNGSILTADDLNSEFGNIYATINNLDEDNLSATTSILPINLNSTLAGDGLARSGTGVLSANVDGTTVKVVADVIKIVDLPGSALATGAVTSAKILDGTIAKVDLASKTAGTPATLGNVGLSGNSAAGELEFTTTAFGDIPNSTLTITTGGGPVRLVIMPGSASTETYIECEDATTDPCKLEVTRDGSTVVMQWPFYTNGAEYRLPPAAFETLDVIGAGTYTYKIKYFVGSATALRVKNIRLMAIEL